MRDGTHTPRPMKDASYLPPAALMEPPSETPSQLLADVHNDNDGDGGGNDDDDDAVADDDGGRW